MRSDDDDDSPAMVASRQIPASDIADDEDGGGGSRSVPCALVFSTCLVSVCTLSTAFAASQPADRPSCSAEPPRTKNELPPSALPPPKIVDPAAPGGEIPALGAHSKAQLRLPS